MRILYSFIGRRVFFCINIAVFVMTLSLLLPVRLPVARAAGGQAVFDMQPAFPDPHNLVTASYFVIDGRPATHLYKSIRVTNISLVRGSVNLYPVDAYTAATGGTTFHTSADARTDVGAWIALKRQQLTLAPGQSQIVPFQLTIPNHVRPGQHIGGIVAEGITAQTFRAKNIHIDLQQLRVIAVQVNLPGTAIEKLVTAGIWLDTANTYQRLLMKLSNTGTMMVKPSGDLQIFDRNGRNVQSQVLRLDTFLPQTSIDYPVYLHQKVLSVGQYRASLTLTYGDRQRLHYTTMFTITAPKKTLSSEISRPVTLGSQDVLNGLSPWQVTVGGGFLLLIVGALGSWVYKRFMMVARVRRRGRGR